MSTFVLLELPGKTQETCLLPLRNILAETCTHKIWFNGLKNKGNLIELKYQTAHKREFLLQDLIFYLQSKKINIAGIVEKEELANLIINHVNSNSYYETTGTHSSSSTTPNNDFENYAQSFDQIKQTCQNLFTSISDKISSGKYVDDKLDDSFSWLNTDT